MLRILLVGMSFAGVGVIGWAVAQSPSKPLSDPKKNLPEGVPPPAATDVDLVERLIAARKEYENTLKALHEHYHRGGDKQRAQWIEKELMGYHLLWKPSYNLDVKDVPPPSLE